MLLLFRMLSRRRLRAFFQNSRYRKIVYLSLVVGAAVVINSLTFYYFEKPVKPELTRMDALWLSFTTITTVGYGDLSASTLWGRVSTIVFMYFSGLTCFAALFSLLVETAGERQEREVKGLKALNLEDHILIVNFPSVQKVRSIILELRSDPATAKTPIVVFTDMVESLPFLGENMEDIGFVSGSPIEEEPYARACLSDARYVIVLARDAQDPNSDSHTAAILIIIEGLNEGVVTIGECVSEKHLTLFQKTRCDRVVLTGGIAARLIVQETHDPGVSTFLAEVTSNRLGSQFYSEETSLEGWTFRDVAKMLLDLPERIILLGVLREGTPVVNPDGGFVLQKGDRLIFVGDVRRAWREVEEKAKSMMEKG